MVSPFSPEVQSSEDPNSTMSSEGSVIQVLNVAPLATHETLQTMFSFIGQIEECKLYPEEDNGSNTSKACFIKYEDAHAAAVALHLNNTVLIDRAIIVQPHLDNQLPDQNQAFTISLGNSYNGGSNSGVINQIVTAAGGSQAIQTIDPRLTALGLAQYPPLPANTEPAKVEEIRRTIYVGNLDGRTTDAEILEFFNQIGEVKYVRMAGDENQPTRFAFIEFTEQSSVANALQYNGVPLGGRPLKINHSNNAIVKPTTRALPVKRELKDLDPNILQKVREVEFQIQNAIVDPRQGIDTMSTLFPSVRHDGANFASSLPRNNNNKDNKRDSRSRSPESRADLRKLEGSSNNSSNRDRDRDRDRDRNRQDYRSSGGNGAIRDTRDRKESTDKKRLSRDRERDRGERDRGENNSQSNSRHRRSRSKTRRSRSRDRKVRSRSRDRKSRSRSRDRKPRKERSKSRDRRKDDRRASPPSTRDRSKDNRDHKKEERRSDRKRESSPEVKSSRDRKSDQSSHGRDDRRTPDKNGSRDKSATPKLSRRSDRSITPTGIPITPTVGDITSSPIPAPSSDDLIREESHPDSLDDVPIQENPVTPSLDIEPEKIVYHLKTEHLSGCHVSPPPSTSSYEADTRRRDDPPKEIEYKKRKDTDRRKSRSRDRDRDRDRDRERDRDRDRDRERERDRSRRNRSRSRDRRRSRTPDRHAASKKKKSTRRSRSRDRR